MLCNCDVGECSWESLRFKEIKPGNPKGSQPWIFIGRTDAEAEALVLWLPELEKTLMLGRMEGRRRSGWWDDWMASRTQWTWVWASSWRWWRKGKPGVLQSLGSQRVGHDWATEQQQYLIKLPWWLISKESTCQCKRCKFYLQVRKSPWRRKWQPTPVFLMGSSMDRGTWWATVHGITKSHDLATK